MPEKTALKKLNAKQVDKLKGKLIEVRRVGSKPIFVEVRKSNSIQQVLDNADVPHDAEETKIEAQRDGTTTWETVTIKNKAINYSKIVVTTKVKGA